MTIITPERLKALSPSIRDDRALAYAPALEACLALGNITSRQRLVHFLAQLAHESAGFRALKENLNYRPDVLLAVFRSRVQTIEKANELVAVGPDAIAEFVYGNRPSLGNVNPGDGGEIYRSRFHHDHRPQQLRHLCRAHQPAPPRPAGIARRPGLRRSGCRRLLETDGLQRQG
ncbi:MAG: hypothetical protein NVV72_11975 [Asticcacaulis sp.]|nr:hypothetical protein [Asticcacaulis sp.]